MFSFPLCAPTSPSPITKTIGSLGGGVCFSQQTTFENDYSVDYTDHGLLGSGASSEVRQALHKNTNTSVAVKIMQKSKLTHEDIEGVRTEISAMTKLRGHQNLVQLIHFYDTAEYFYVVLEYVHGGELFQRLVELEKYTEEEARRSMRQMVDAVQYMHSHNLVHRDLKPENVLLVDERIDSPVKIADFGFTKETKPGHRTLMTRCGTPGYVAPEIVTDVSAPYGKEVDIWSLGVMLYILLCGYPPFYSEKPGDQGQRELFRQIRKAKYQFHSPEWDGVSANAKDLIRGMLTLHPDKRLTAAAVLQHPWIANSASDVPLPDTQRALRRFNARRKMRSAMHAVKATVMLRRILAAVNNADGDENASPSVHNGQAEEDNDEDGDSAARGKARGGGARGEV